MAYGRGEGPPIGPSPEQRPDDAVMRLTAAIFLTIVSDLLMSFPGNEYEDIPWQFRETGTDALAMHDPA